MIIKQSDEIIKQSDEIVVIPILKARLCLDCGVIHTSAIQCPKCASGQCPFLVKFLK